MLLLLIQALPNFLQTLGCLLILLWTASCFDD